MLKRKIVENTAVRTAIISSEFKTDHSTPNTLRRYFSLKSLETRDRRINHLSRTALYLSSYAEHVPFELRILANFPYKGLVFSVWRGCVGERRRNRSYWLKCCYQMLKVTCRTLGCLQVIVLYFIDNVITAIEEIYDSLLIFIDTFNINFRIRRNLVFHTLVNWVSE